ncbi:hypothetical protein Pst134EA_022718 [Puccinia striiformis f. sp. tritici]|uniref:hypothetical protein n=1 Tax=Puccinia striiformis f. sp. tritici TaxID=168172 RepID=UPI0020080598|nr:hypothetical protein Pst134EA_022718 [Puccinia striiformis f. sp. tritici]KAH9455245.1 hypothetical protein Pst134EA_022718 [Puccinia striiformis f. sp. tritici]
MVDTTQTITLVYGVESGLLYLYCGLSRWTHLTLLAHPSPWSRKTRIIKPIRYQSLGLYQQSHRHRYLTAIAGILKRQLNRDSIGMSASFGNAIWLLWAISGLLLFASFGYLGGCIRGRRSQAVV